MSEKKKNAKTIAIIPARGGSKRFPRKNLAILAGKPLLAHTIEAALACEDIERSIVSTDDPEIAEVAKQLGAEVCRRPSELASDTASPESVVQHVLNEFLDTFPETIVYLQPTSPLRTAQDIHACLEIFKKRGAKSTYSVTETEHHPYKNFRIENNCLVPFHDAASLSANKQVLPKVFRQNGAIYVLSAESFRKENSFFLTPAVSYEMSTEQSVDIDTELDLKLCELLKK